MFREAEARKEIEEIIDGMDIDEQYYLFYEYCENVNYYDDRPESVDSIDELCYGMKPSEIISTYGDMDLSWNYFQFNGYGYPIEWEGIDCVSDVVDYIIENENALDNDDIQEVLDKYSETEELYIKKEDFDKVINILEEKEIEYEYDEEETELKIFSDDYDIVTEILDELEIEY